MNMFESPIPSRPIKKDTIIKNYKKTGPEVFQHYLEKNSKLREEDFSDIYSVDEIKEDKRRVEAMKMSKSYEKPTSHGIVLENLVTDIAEKYEWFGKGAKIVQLTESDDMLINHAHADIVVEIPVDPEDKNSQILRLGVDLTTAIDNDTLLKKKSKSIEGVRTGKLATVKYFQSKQEDVKGKMEKIPVVVAGIDKETLARVCSDVAKDDDFIMKNHEVQIMFLNEIKYQLETMLALAMNPSVGQQQLEECLNDNLEMIDYLIFTKKNLYSKDFEQRSKSDAVYSYITKYF